MKTKILIILFALVCGNYIAQTSEQLTKEVEVFETVEENKRDVSVGAIVGPIKYLGEYASETNLGFGIVIEKHINPKFNMQYNVYSGKVGYTDSSDVVNNTTYFGLDAMFSANIIELIKDKEENSRFSPYLSLGLGVLNSKANHYVGDGQIDFSIPAAVGANFFVTRKLSVGVDINARYLFSDNFDNSLTSSINDIILTPSLTLKFLVGQKRVSKRVSKYKTISYNKPVEEEKTYEIYKEPEYDISAEPFVEVVVKTPERKVSNTNGDVASNWTSRDNSSNESEEDNNDKEDYVKEENNTDTDNGKVYDEIVNDDNLFYTIQVGSYPGKDVDLKRKKGMHQDYVLFNDDLNLYNYLYGMYGSRSEAESDAKRVSRKVRGCFVVAVYKGKRINKREADKMVAKNPNLINIEASKANY